MKKQAFILFISGLILAALSLALTANNGKLDGNNTAIFHLSLLPLICAILCIILAIIEQLRISK